MFIKMEREKCVEIWKALICRSCGHGSQTSSTCYLWFDGPYIYLNGKLILSSLFILFFFQYRTDEKGLC